MNLLLQFITKFKFTISPLALIFTLLYTPATIAGIQKYQNNWGKSGYSVESQKNSNIIINYSITEFTLQNIELSGKQFTNIELPGHFLPNDAGSPNLPGSGRYIAIPQNAQAELNIMSFRTDTINNIQLAPSFRIPWDTDNRPLDYSKNEAIFSANKFFPENPIILSDKDIIRGVNVVMLGVTPFQYNPVSKQLIVYRDIKIEIKFQGGSGVFSDERLRSRWWDPILSDMLLNYESLPEMNYNRSFQTKDETGCEYLVITPNDIEFQIWADSIREFRTTQGILTKVVTLDEIGGNTASIIEDYIDNAYATWDIVPAACLLLGDYGTDASNRIISPIYDNYCVSDNIFADINGNDLPDIVFARITAQDETQLSVMVTKFTHYEKSPPTYDSFYHNPITSLGWQTESWFQICSEAIGGFWREVQGKEPIRINAISSGTPGNEWSTAANTDAVVATFGPDGLGYIPESPSELGGWTGGNSDMINNTINDGTFMIQHRDHGFENGWSQPAYANTDINDLINTDLTFIWSTDPLTGKFNYSTEVFAERFHRYTHKDENSGCFGINAASEITYAFVSDVFVWGAYDNMWPDFFPEFGSNPEPRGVLPAFANAAGKYFLEQSSWPSISENKDVTYHLFHHHGDAFTTVYSEVPQNLTIVHEPILYMGETTFEVTADENALIGLSVNGELVGTAMGTGAPVTIDIPAQTPPDQLLVTVTKQNYFRYESYVEVIPSSGPYVVYNSVDINDEGGNGNGLMETSEVIFASITIKNVGVEDADNVVVTLSTTDTFVTITDDSDNYGTVPAGTTAVNADGFSWEVADNIPDMHVVDFMIEASDGSSSWTSGFSITGHAPAIEFGTMLIDDYVGNWNGRLDPGETAFLILPTMNNGSYVAVSTMGTLSCSNEFITLNNATFNFYDIGAGLSEEGMFEVSVSEEAPAGEYIELNYEVTTGGYIEQHLYSTIVSPVVEDWETGDMSQFDWTTGGDSDWAISTDSPYEGSFCIKSGELDHDQTTYLSIPFESYAEDSVSFWCKVSSETGYDFLKFYIDDVEQAAWSGEVEWEKASFPLAVGSHTLKWSYIKDESLSSGNDCAYIDFIVFPVAAFEASFTSDETDICEGDIVTFTDQSVGEILSWEWSFEGGIPETSTLQNPEIEYTTSGVFDVSLTISDGDATNTVTIEDYILVSAIPEMAPSPTGPDSVCATEVSTTFTTDGLSGITIYEWVLEPTEAGLVSGSGLTATVDWETEYQGNVSLKVAGTNDCGTGLFSDPLQINRYLPEVTLEPFEWICLDWPAIELSGGMPEGGVYSGPGVDNGWFDPFVAGIGTHMITYTYSDANNCENFATETILVDPCTGITELTNNLGIHIYPNPTNGSINIELNNQMGITEVEIVNSLNKTIYTENINSHSQNKLSIDLSDQAKGLYIIIVKTNNIEERQKIILK